MITTGDPTIDAILTWINTGAKLNNATAVIGLAATLRFLVVPGLTWVTGDFKKPINAKTKVVLIHVIGIIMAIITAILTHSPMSPLQSALVGFAASNAAIGLHQTSVVGTESQPDNVLQ